MGLFNQGAGNNRTVLQHILQVHQIAVVHMLSIVVRIMEVDDSGLVGVHNVLRKQDAAGNVLAHFAGHIVPLHSIDGGILIGIFLFDFLVVGFDQAENPVVRGIGLTGQASGIAVSNVGLCHFKSAMGHNGLLHQVLNFFHRGAAAHLLAGNLYTFRNAANLQRRHPHRFFHCFVGFCHRHGDFFNIKNDFRAVSLNDFHSLSPFLVS